MFLFCDMRAKGKAASRGVTLAKTKESGKVRRQRCSAEVTDNDDSNTPVRHSGFTKLYRAIDALKNLDNVDGERDSNDREFYDALYQQVRCDHNSY